MRLLATGVATLVLSVAAADGARAAPPARGVTYSAQDQSLTFVVSRDGKRAYDFLGTLPGTCPGDQGAVPTRLTFGKRGAAKVSGERLSLSESGPLRDDDSFFASGSFGARGLFTGTAKYASAEACNSSASFTAVAQPRQAGTSRRAYPLLGVTESAVAVASMAGGAIAVAETPEDESGARIRRIDRDGRSRTLVRSRSARDAIGDVARLRDGSLVFSQPRRNRVLRRTAKGKLTVAATGLRAPDQVAAAPDGGFAFTDGDTGVQRVDRAGKRTLVATASSVGGVAVGRDGSVLFSSAGQIRRIKPGGATSVAAGTGVLRFSGDNGPATAAGMDPGALAALPGGGFVFVDGTVGTLRQVSASGRITTYAGGGEVRSGAAGTRAAIDPLSVDVLADGGVTVTQANDVTMFPASGNRRLLVGLPERDAVYTELLKKRRPLPVRLTRRARVRLTVYRGQRTLGRVTTRPLPAGTRRIRVPRKLRGDSVTVRASAGRAIAEAY